MNTNIEYVGRDAIVECHNVAFSYKVNDTPREFQNNRPKVDDLNWNDKHSYIGDFIVYPYGNNNDLPEIIKDVVHNNNLAPGILTKKTQLLWGSGPMLYREIIENRKLIKDWQENTTVKNWLESWAFEDYLLKMCVDYQHMQGMFSKYIQSRGSRIGQRFIHSLEHIPVDKARLATMKQKDNRKPTHVITTDWSFSKPSSLSEYKAYNLFDFTKPFEHKNAILYSNMYSFCTDYYTVPDLYGSLEWLKRSTAIPLIFKALSRNGINLKYHIESPQGYWDAKREIIKQNCTDLNIPYKESMLDEFQNKMLKKISEVLSGEENTGKFMHTIKTVIVEGNNLIELGWEIKVIDQKIKDFVEANISIADRADRAVSSGIGLHGALGNITDSGKSDSGSEQLYALKNFMATGIDIPEMIVMKAINYALKANFPELKLKLGFYHQMPEKEQDINPENRLKNSI